MPKDIQLNRIENKQIPIQKIRPLKGLVSVGCCASSSSVSVRSIRQLLVRHIAVECRCCDICVTKQMLNRPHSDAQRIFLRCECPTTAVTRCAYSSCQIDRFEAQAQRDIAEVPSSTSAANECLAPVEFSDRCKIAVQHLLKVVTDEHSS